MELAERGADKTLVERWQKSQGRTGMVEVD